MIKQGAAFEMGKHWSAFGQAATTETPPASVCQFIF